MVEVALPASIDEVRAYFASLDDFTGTGMPTIEHLDDGEVRLRWLYDETRLRPGGYVSGPTLFSIADLAGWILVFTSEGIEPMAVTWDLHITFLRPAVGGDVVAVAKRLKRGRRLIYGEVTMAMDHAPDTPVAHATLTYALP